MSESMIERATKAIDSVMTHEDDADPTASRRYARAVIEAMRLPVEAMLEAGAQEGSRIMLATGYPANAPGDFYRAMIDAALKEQP